MARSELYRLTDVDLKSRLNESSSAPLSNPHIRIDYRKGQHRMVAPARGSNPEPRSMYRRVGMGVLATCFGLMAIVALGSWWFTAPLQPKHRTLRPSLPSPAVFTEKVAAEPEPLKWPEKPLRGPEAKTLLLRALDAASERLAHVDGYTATFHRQEKVDGVLRPAQTMLLKVRQRPFAIYLKFLKPKGGREVVFAEGQNDNKLIAHNGDWTRHLIPRLAVAPTDPLALADNRHPVTEAGLTNLTRKLIRFREMDVHDPEAVTILDRTKDEHGRELLRSTHIHPHRQADRPFARVVVYYDPESFIPVRIESYDWPARDGTEARELAESYAYDDLKLDVPLDDIDFDPANPAYAFTRF